MNTRTGDHDPIIVDIKIYIAALQRELSKRQLNHHVTSGQDHPVSDHALVRYLERVKGFNLDLIRDEILTPQRKSMLKSGPGRIQGDGYELVCADGKVVTVLPSGGVKR